MIVLAVSCVWLIVTKQKLCICLLPSGTDLICVESLNRIFQCCSALTICIPWALHACDHGDVFTADILTIALVTLSCSVSQPVVVPRVLEVQQSCVFTSEVSQKSRETALARHGA